ncbi:MAG: ImmA/IrrE family metallo-endopeptidase [Acutalibacteraceae bacterium]
MNKISNERKTQIKSVVLNLLKEYKNVYLPMPVKSIAKSLKNCRVIPYSTILKNFNLSKSDIPKLFNSNDACSDYDSNNDRYIIYYNDTDESITDSNRYRWNIAHELGHILLKHHQNENTRLFRNCLSQKEYSIFEYEANIFAAYLLVPHVILYFQGVHSCSDIARLCKISQSASQTRYSEYMYWLKNSKFVDKYDKEFKFYFTNPQKHKNKYSVCIVKLI